MKIKRKKHRKEFEEYLEEQLGILKGHYERIMLRILNKMIELENSEKKIKCVKYQEQK